MENSNPLALASGPQHKRKGSAVDQLQSPLNPPSGKAARSSEGGGEQASQEQQGPELTQTCSLHLLQLRSSQEELLKKIDAITGAGTAFLDQLRAAFLQRMERVKGELGQMVDQAEIMLREQSAATLDSTHRAHVASHLIDKLNIKTVDVEQQRPDALFSAQEEAGEGGPSQEGGEPTAGHA